MSRGSIRVSDPWELASIVGDQPLLGSIEIGNAEFGAIRFDRPISINGATIEYAEVTTRHLGTSFAEHCNAVPANILFLSADGTGSFPAIGSVSVD
jgi:hypothetical protein